MRNYAYSARQPDDDIEVVRQMRQAVKYRNTLVSLELRRRRLRDRLGDAAKTPEMRERLNKRHAAAGKRARRESGLYWGTYLAVEQDAEEFSRGDAPRFCGWTGAGRLGVQVQKGMSVERLLSGADSRLRLLPGGHPKGRILWMRIGGVGRTPLWCRIPVTWHRDLPADARIKWCRLRRYLVGDRVRWQVIFSVTSQRDQDGDDPAASRSECGIDVNYRVLGGSQRVATAYGHDGRTYELWLPPRVIGALTECEQIASQRKLAFNAAKARLLALLADPATPAAASVTALLRAEAATLAQWKSERRLSQWVAGWERLGGCPRWLSNWKRTEDQEHDRVSQLRAQALGQRQDVYRCWAAMLARRYKIAYLERLDLRAGFHGITGTSDDVEAHTPQRRRANWACVSSLRQMLCERMLGVVVPAAKTTTQCHACGQDTEIDGRRQVVYTCEHCGAEWDQDENAARNILERGRAFRATREALGEDGQTTWTGRRKKRVSRSERNAQARARCTAAREAREREAE